MVIQPLNFNGIEMDIGQDGSHKSKLVQQNSLKFGTSVDKNKTTNIEELLFSYFTPKGIFVGGCNYWIRKYAKRRNARG